MCWAVALAFTGGASAQIVPQRFPFQFQDAKWDDVFSAYAKLSGVKLVGAPKPQGTFTFKPARPEERFTPGEITDLINGALAQQKLLLFRGTKSFRIVKADEKIDPRLVPVIDFKDLRTHGRTELAEVAIPLEVDIAGAEEELRKLLTPRGEIVIAKGRWLIVRDTVGSIARIAKTLEPITNRADNQKTGGVPALKKLRVIHLIEGVDSDEIATTLCKLFPVGTAIVPVPGQSALLIYVTDAEAKEARAVLFPLALPDELEQAPAPRPAPERFSFQFQDATWDDVFSAYVKLSGTKLIGAPKPKGAFTFKPVKPEQRFTLAEITDIINDELLTRKHLLIRRYVTFCVVPTNEKIDSMLAPRIRRDELLDRGRTEVVQMVVLVEGAIPADVIDELQLEKLLSPFGRIIPLRGAGMILQDMAGNVVKIQKKIDEYHSRQ
ncbi:hypothetical protein [Gemmata massiliana]|uniref:hypothetical protein n=1 Tax=Gemmata massiliana TaxID=1210884 RepID=UPI0013A6EC2C|nr:hypothetical protein [Gemmata massiliana]